MNLSARIYEGPPLTLDCLFSLAHLCPLLEELTLPVSPFIATPSKSWFKHVPPFTNLCSLKILPGLASGYIYTRGDVVKLARFLCPNTCDFICEYHGQYSHGVFEVDGYDGNMLSTHRDGLVRSWARDESQQILRNQRNDLARELQRLRV